MPSLLERIPYDILLNITFMSASASNCRPPQELLNLRLTCKTLHSYLSIRDSAQLYSRLFHCHFDPSPLLLNSPVTLVNDSTLADEYVLRQRFLSRCRHSSWSSSALLASDMWTALHMLLESNGINDKQLVAANFPKELFQLALAHLKVSDASDLTYGSDSQSLGLKCLFIWLLSTMLSKLDIAKIPAETREKLCDLLRVYITTKPTTSGYYDFRSKIPQHEAPPHGGIISSSNHYHQGSTLYSQHQMPIEFLNPSWAAVNVIFGMKEACPLLIPPHLPETRAIAANLYQTSGPTMEDFREFQSYQTPLFADTVFCGVGEAARPPVHLGRSRSHDHELSYLYGSSDAAQVLEAGTFSGLWQGSYMTHTVDEAGVEGYLHRRPLQVHFTEYHCYSPGVPIASSEGASELSLFPTRPLEICHSTDHRYEKETGTTAQEQRKPVSGVAQISEAQKPRVILDTMLFGETTDDHDAAWKGFRYVGRIHRDGMIYLKREPKNQSEDYLGTWMFEGRLRFGKALVGIWRARNSTDSQGARGIFSMAKVDHVRH